MREGVEINFICQSCQTPIALVSMEHSVNLERDTLEVQPQFESTHLHLDIEDRGQWNEEYEGATDEGLQVNACVNVQQLPVITLANNESVEHMDTEADDSICGAYQLPTPVIEATLQDNSPLNNVADQEVPAVHYTIVKTATERGRSKLCDSVGFSYCVKSATAAKVSWRCTVRNKALYCRATVIERDNQFTPGAHPHSHPPNVGCTQAAQVVSDIRERAIVDLFKPAAQIVNAVLIDNGANLHCPALAKPANLSRQANYLRQTRRPKDPLTLNFELDLNHIPEDFLVSDVFEGLNESRHLIFATSQMLSLLSKAKRWYIDATFKVVRKPFTQLLSIHAFVKADTTAKQVPLIFALMGSRRKRDYRQVFRAILASLPEPPVVAEMLLDFERSIWSAAKKELPNVSLRGCVFHWTQAVWRRIQHEGLAASYLHDTDTYRFCKQVMALPFLPHEHIVTMFSTLRENATCPAFTNFLSYMNTTWMESSIWPPPCWTVFMQPIRTNNDVEGWHHRLNRHAAKA